MPQYKVHPVAKLKNGKTYYLMHTSYKGFNEAEARELSKSLIEEKGYADTYIEEVDGYYYVWGNPGITIEELKKLVERFTLIEYPAELLDELYFSTFKEDPELASMWVTCRHCGHSWFTQSQMNLVTCPNCSYKTPRHRAGSDHDKKSKKNLKEEETMGKSGKMTKADAARIQSRAAKKGTNQDFARRAQSAADRNAK